MMALNQIMAKIFFIVAGSELIATFYLVDGFSTNAKVLVRHFFYGYHEELLRDMCYLGGCGGQPLNQLLFLFSATRLKRLSYPTSSYLPKRWPMKSPPCRRKSQTTHISIPKKWPSVRFFGIDTNLELSLMGRIPKNQHKCHIFGTADAS